jgi:hypothetical protein
MRGATIAAAVVTIVILVGVLLTPVTIMQAITAEGEPLVCARVHPDTSMVLTYTHSMFGGKVWETYRLGDDDALRRTRMMAERAAAAEYYAWDGAVAAVDDGYEVLVPEQEFDALAIRVDQIGNHRLEIGGESYDLASMVDGSARVWLEITSQPLLAQVLGTGC